MAKETLKQLLQLPLCENTVFALYQGFESFSQKAFPKHRICVGYSQAREG